MRRRDEAVILYDAAYEAYIRDADIPHSIYEIDGAREVAIEFRSFSKTAGFTGTRCAFTVVPKELHGSVRGRASRVSLHALWFRRQTTKFNGVSYIIQRGAAAVYTRRRASGRCARRSTSTWTTRASSATGSSAIGPHRLRRRAMRPTSG